MSARTAAARRLAERVRRRRSVILCYHGVGPADSRVDPHFLRAAPEAFRAQVELLRDAGFEFVTVSELVRRAGGGPLPPGLAALTFDDGMDDNLTVLLPLLREWGIPATVYVITGLLGRPNPWMELPGARLMTEPELRELHAAGVELGAHTVTHPDLSELDEEACFAEVDGSRRALEGLTGGPVETFAYPFCHSSPAARAAVERAGLSSAVVCLDRRGDHDPLLLPRTMITGKDGLPSFLLKLADAYEGLFDSRLGRVVRPATRLPRRYLRRLREAT